MSESFNYDRAATVLAEAAFHGDGPTAERHGVSTRSIERWRQRAQTDAGLAGFVALKKRQIADGWVLDVNRALARGAAYILTTVDTLPPTAENLRAVVGMMKILADATLTRDALDARHPEPYRPASPAGGSVVPLDGGRARRAG